ncbi:MAG: hypothetical protein ACYS7M_09940, partial [Planctomycetota bacterium]
MSRGWLYGIGLACLAGASIGCVHGRDSDPQTRENPMSEEPAQVMQTSDDPKELIQAAVQLARSEQRSDQEALLKSMRSQDFLLKLNSQEEYWGNPKGLRVARILEALRKNKASCARDTILELTKNPVFIKEGGRVDLLLKATAVVRPAPPELVTFWDKHCQPDDGFTPLTIRALVENGSKPALELLEKKMADAQHEDATKIDWMRTKIMPRRNQAALLQSCERLLSDGLAEHLRPELVDALFDYKPEKWFKPAVSYNPPPMS